MNCKEFKNIIADYLGQNLNSDHEKQFAEHLQKCSECSLLFEKTNKTLSFLDNPERIPEQAFYFTQLKQKMEKNLHITVMPYQLEKLSRPDLQLRLRPHHDPMLECRLQPNLMLNHHLGQQHLRQSLRQSLKQSLKMVAKMFQIQWLEWPWVVTKKTRGKQ